MTEKKVQLFVKMLGGCGHTWYVIPDDLDEKVREQPAKCPFCQSDCGPAESNISGDRLQGFIRILGDCGHPWYVIPDELNEHVKEIPLICPFCDEDGDPLNSLISQVRGYRSKARKQAYKNQRKRIK